MNLKDISIKYGAITLLILIMIPLLIFFSITNYMDVKNNILKNVSISTNNVSDYIVNAIKLNEGSYDFVSSFYDRPMEEALNNFRKSYDLYKEDIDNWNMDDLKINSGNLLDFYVISDDGVIIKSTAEYSVGLDFKQWPDYYRDITSVRLSDKISISNVSNDEITNELRKWGFISTSDHKYLLEVGIVANELGKYISSLNYQDLVMSLIEKNDAILDIEIYDVYGNNLTENVDVDKSGIEIINKLMITGEDYTIANKNGLPEIEYRLVEPYKEQLDRTEKIIVIKYDYNNLENQLRNAKILIIIFVVSSIIIGTMFSWFIITRYVTNPIIKFSNSLEIKSLKEITDEFKGKVYQKNELGKLITAFCNLSINLNETLVSKDYLENLIESFGDIVIIADKDMNITRVNDSALEFLKYEKKELLRKNLMDVIKFENLIEYIEKNFTIKNHNILIEKSDGNLVSALVSITVTKNELNSSLSYICNAKDMTEANEQSEKLKELNNKLIIEEKQLRYMAITDGLTKIFNRTYALKKLEEILEECEETLSLAILDVDFFKKVNDDYGHPVGDSVLIELTQLISACIKENWIFARYGGEEFVVIMPETLINEAEQSMEEIRKSIAENKFDKIDRNITISIGIAESSVESMDNLLKKADRMLYKAKENGRNRIEI